MTISLTSKIASPTTSIETTSNVLTTNTQDTTVNTNTIGPTENISGLPLGLGIDHSDVKVAAQRADGSTTVVVESKINRAAAINSSVSTLQVSFGKIVGDSSTSQQTRNSLSPTGALDTILNSAPDLDRREEEIGSNVVRSVKTDITSKLNNTTSSKLIGSRSGNETLREIANVTSDELGEVLNTVPILQVPTRVGTLLQESNRDSSILGADSILVESRSPADVGNQFIPYTPIEFSLAGTNGPPSPTGQIVGNNVTSIENLTSDLLQGPVGSIDKAGDLGGGVTTIPSTIAGQSDVITTSSTIVLTAADLETLENTSVLTVSALDSSGNIVSEASCAVDIVEKILDASTYDDLLSTVTGATSEPTAVLGHVDDLEGSLDSRDKAGILANKPGVTSNEVEDTAVPSDGPGQGGTGGYPPLINEFERSIPTVESLDDSQWVPAGTSDTTSPSTLGFDNGGGTTTLGRGSTGGFSPLSPFFVEKVKPAQSRNLASANPFLGDAVAETDNRFVSLTTFLRREGITVRVGNFQGEYSISVWRRDLTLGEKEHKILQVPEPIQLVSRSSAPVNFVDKNVKVEHIYEYRAKIHTRKGRVIFSTGYSVIKHQELNANAVKLKVSTPKMTIDSNGQLDVKFNITAEIAENNVTTAAQILKDQNLDSFYESEINQQKERIKSLIVYNIQRHDLTRGVVEDFGIFTKTTFSDKENRELSNVRPLRSQTDYRYVVSALLRNVDEILPKTILEIQDDKTKRTYNLQPSKWRHPKTLNRGTLRADSVISKADLTEEFMAGFSGAQKFVNISTKTPKPKVTSGMVKKTARGNIEMRWNLQGDSRRIDHFLIMGRQLGMKSILGRVHGISTNNVYRFEDRILSKYVGETTYSVCPVYLDYTRGQEVIIGTIAGKQRDKKRR